MKPVAIVQHEADAPPAYFARWLHGANIPFEVIRIDLGDAVPDDPRRFSGLCSMGGSMSVNDPLPWVEQECALMRAADAAGVPVIGHCLGGQLLAKALGAPVARHPVKEIGWHRLQVSDVALASDWLGADGIEEAQRAEWFQWHGDSFSLPAGGRNFLASRLCVNQAFVVERPGCWHLGMQFHCEMTPELVAEWALGESGVAEIAQERDRNSGPGAQAPAAIVDAVESRAQSLNRLAARLYARWSRGLDRS